MSAFETNKFDLLYGKLLGKGISQTLAKQLTATLLRLSKDSGISTDELIRDVTINGIRFNNAIYNELNRYRSNSSQVGYIDPNNIPLAVSNQLPIN